MTPRVPLELFWELYCETSLGDAFLSDKRIMISVYSLSILEEATVYVVGYTVCPDDLLYILPLYVYQLLMLLARTVM